MLCWQTACRATRLQPGNVHHIKNSLSYCHLKHSLRLFMTSANSGFPTPNHDIYVSASSDPYFNLTLEDWLFRHAPSSSPLLLIYRDSPSVIIGRNQNPWTEVNFPALHASGISFLRRRSGGGTVYHDLGNTNFSIHLPRTSFDRFATGRLILRAVRSLGIDAQLNERNDICVGPDKMRSAYKIVSHRAYHHGTMLLSTELDVLGDVLRPPKENIVTKGVGSVRSPVCNLRRFDPSLTHDIFTSAVISQFREEYGTTTEARIIHDSEDVRNIDYIRKGMSELSTWDWAYGQTPAFTHTLDEVFSWGHVTAEIYSKHGIILDFSVTITNALITTAEIDSIRSFCQTFYQGKRYGFLNKLEDKQVADLGLEPGRRAEVEYTPLIRELHVWLQHTINIR